MIMIMIFCIAFFVMLMGVACSAVVCTKLVCLCCAILYFRAEWSSAALIQKRHPELTTFLERES
jgi:hypothetical protein